MTSEADKIPGVSAAGNMFFHPVEMEGGGVGLQGGITVREFVATQIMQGLVAGCGRNGYSFNETNRMASDAARMADELLEACEWRHRIIMKAQKAKLQK